MPGAEVYVNPRRFAPSLKWSKKLGATDQKGRFEVHKSQISPGREVLLVSKKGYRPVVVPRPKEGKVLLVPLEKGATLEIVLVEPGGKPIKGIPVALSRFFPFKVNLFPEYLKSGRIPSIPPSFPLFRVEKSDDKGRCFFWGLDPKARYGVWVVTRTMTTIDRTPRDPRGDSGKMVITLAPLFGIWARFKGDRFETGSLIFPQLLERNFFCLFRCNSP